MTTQEPPGGQATACRSRSGRPLAWRSLVDLPKARPSAPVYVAAVLLCRPMGTSQGALGRSPGTVPSALGPPSPSLRSAPSSVPTAFGAPPPVLSPRRAPGGLPFAARPPVLLPWGLPCARTHGPREAPSAAPTREAGALEVGVVDCRLHCFAENLY